MKKIYKFIALLFTIGTLNACGNSNTHTAKTVTPQPFITETAAPTPTPVTKDYNSLYLPDWIRWGMDIQEVKDNEDRRIDSSLGNDNTNYYLTLSPKQTDYYSSSYGTEYIYAFNDDKLISYFIMYNDKKSIYSINSIQMYDNFKNAVSQKYGEPKKEDIIWSDETYKNDSSQFEKAFKYGYVTMKCEWLTDNTNITLEWDYKKNMALSYTPL